MMKVLITGVAGRIGSALAKRLADEGHQVRGTTRPGGRTPSSTIPETVEVYEASLTDTSELANAVAGADVIVHLAAQIVIGDTPADDYFNMNVLGTLRLLEASAQQDKPPRFIFGSTDNTYGPGHPQSGRITEDHQQDPGDYYGTSKVLCEHLIRNFGQIHGLDFTILRYGSVLKPEEALPLYRLDWVRAFLDAQLSAGPRSNLWPLFKQSKTVLDVLEAAVKERADNPAIVLTGPDGEPWSIHLTDVRDAISGTVLAVETTDVRNQAFNIVGPRTTTFEEGAGVAAKQFGVDIVRTELPIRLAFELSTAKAQEMLGYTPKWDFGSIIESAMAG
jgi:UDP-glucose 4-epimerase